MDETKNTNIWNHYDLIINMIKYLVILSIFISGSAFAATKIFYNKDGEITIQEMATHYRLATIDPESKKFKGHIMEFNMTDQPFLELNYDSTGNKSGLFKYNRFGLLLEGGFENNLARTSIPDSILEAITKKEHFVQSIYIRKLDYTELKSILLPTSQSTDSVVVQGQVFRIVEDAPSFPGGMAVISQFLSYHLTYPAEAKKKGIKGKVLVEFTIASDGTIRNIKTIKGIGYGCDEAAEFAISMLPDWKPGYQRGKPVPVRMVLPITFQ